ncbi:hypothetical protein BGX21_000460 [Mortierella sp. AD011]|nr:hypothetical protein BGX20_011214 [Mortierella sp. AD010]KAF9401822.1 hypothetical protein BGX21_000460 [Mortierella sp. AD011]
MPPPPLKEYANKLKGQRYIPTKYIAAPKPPSRFVILLSSFVGSFTGIAVVSALTYNVSFFVDRNVPVMAGSLGASAVLIYGAIDSPLSQPRNVIGGHLMSSLISVSLFKLFNLLSPEMFLKLHWLLCALAVSVSLFLMQLTHTVHPPASATALIAVTGGQTIYDLGYWYVLCPIALGVALMMTIALIVNNLGRRYPLHWWSPKRNKIMLVDQDMSKPIGDFVTEDDDDETDDDRVAQDDTTTTVNGENPVSRSSTLSDLQSTANELSVPHHHRHSHQPISRVQSRIRRDSESQFAVFYGDENEIMSLGRRSSFSPHDLELGHVETHGSHPHSGIATLEERYRHTIQQLKNRIHELESQLAEASKEA